MSSKRNIISTCNGETVSMVPAKLVKHYNKLATETKDLTDKELYLQYAEHYKKVVRQNAQKD